MNVEKTLIDKWRETRSQRELARLLGVSEQRLSNWKTGVEAMPDHHFAHLAELVEGEEKARSLLWDFVQQKRREMKATGVVAGGKGGIRTHVTVEP